MRAVWVVDAFGAYGSDWVASAVNNVTVKDAGDGDVELSFEVTNVAVQDGALVLTPLDGDPLFLDGPDEAVTIKV